MHDDIITNLIAEAAILVSRLKIPIQQREDMKQEFLLKALEAESSCNSSNNDVIFRFCAKAGKNKILDIFKRKAYIFNKKRIRGSANMQQYRDNRAEHDFIDI